MIRNKFDNFFINRQSLIDQFKKGDLTKEEFIESNYLYIQSMNTKPFRKIDNMKKGLFNYQYYNTLAKYYQKRANETSRNRLQKEDFLEIANDYYAKKDMVTLKILEMIDYIGVDAYHVKVNSPNLKNKLFEIVLHDYENVILHSKNEIIKNRLIEERVFRNEKQKSVIDNYINQKY